MAFLSLLGVCMFDVLANEPYELWEGMDRRSDSYKKLKEERAEALWQV